MLRVLLVMTSNSSKLLVRRIFGCGGKSLLSMGGVGDAGLLWLLKVMMLRWRTGPGSVSVEVLGPSTLAAASLSSSAFGLLANTLSLKT